MPNNSLLYCCCWIQHNQCQFPINRVYGLDTNALYKVSQIKRGTLGRGKFEKHRALLNSACCFLIWAKPNIPNFIFIYFCSYLRNYIEINFTYILIVTFSLKDISIRVWIRRFIYSHSPLILFLKTMEMFYVMLTKFYFLF